jgi:hypothetical protein
MSWLDEAVSRRRLAQRNAESTKAIPEEDASTLPQRQQQSVEAFDPLIQRLLTEYGEFAFPKNFFQKRFLIRLERPGHNAEKSWHWHWHLYSLTKHTQSIEVHPRFAPDGMIIGFTLLKGHQRIEVEGNDETPLKEGLVSLYMQG